MQVFVANSGKQKGLSQPFGYLKASTNLTHVTLFVMPYNYPSLLPLIGMYVYCCYACVRLNERKKNKERDCVCEVEKMKGREGREREREREREIDFVLFLCQRS